MTPPEAPTTGAAAIDRRTLVQGATIGVPALLLPAPGLSANTARPMGSTMPPGPGPALPPLFNDLERRTFQFFWDRTNPENGLMPDRWPSPSFSSIAAIGYALTAYPIAVERGWVSRAAAAARTLTTLRFLDGLPSGDAPTGTAGYRGFFYHFLDMQTGLRHEGTELSTVDSSLLFMGMLHAAGWFDGPGTTEAAIRSLGVDLVERAEWDWFQHSGLGIPMGWHPETGFIDRNWDGYNEGKLVYILALGATRHPAADDSWAAWTAPYPRFWRGEGLTRRLAFAPLFGHQYSEIWIDFRGIFDAPMREAGFDYFENSRRSVLSNRGWCMTNPLGWAGYRPDIWGLTACDGPGYLRAMHNGRETQFQGYSARGPLTEPDGYDDGTIAPTAAIASTPFAPDLCIRAAMAMHRDYGRRLYGQYGFHDAFNPSFRDTSARVDNGSVDAASGWVGGDWLGIDQGAILAMLANYRSESVWRVMRRSPTIVRGLRRAGFTGGWLEGA